MTKTAGRTIFINGRMFVARHEGFCEAADFMVRVPQKIDGRDEDVRRVLDYFGARDLQVLKVVRCY